MRLLWLAALAGCLPSSSVVCGDGRVCPDDQVCAHVTDPAADLCADPSQLQACEGLARYAHCVANGRCYDGVCLQVACGNGRIDRADPADPLDDGEVCDDGNERTGDGCSSDCRSDETCGNGVVDSIKLERCDDGNLLSNDGCDSVCQPERPSWHQLGVGPDARIKEMLAYDLMRDRMVMFGGNSADETPFADTWEGTPTGFVQRTPVQSPPPRIGSAMVYDVSHRQVMLFGGAGSGQTWLWDGTNWSEAIVIDGPTPRNGHAMTYDPKRGQTILFGGRPTGSVGLDSETWAWDGTTWTEREPATVPHGHAGHAMVYDPKRDVVVMWGGVVDTSVWEYDGTDWREVPASGSWPPLRSNPSMAWDPIREEVILVGGDDGDPTDLGDVWSWNGTRWQRMHPLDPAILPGHAITTDLRRGRVVLVGEVRTGDVLTSGPLSTWTWDGASWELQPVGTASSATTTSAALDPISSKFVLLGSMITEELDGFGWVARAQDPTDQRVDTQIADDVTRREMLVFGGADLTGTPLGDTWSLDMSAALPRWTQLQPSTSPSPRISPALAYFAKTRASLLFGGAACTQPSCAPYADTWEWDGSDWTLASPVHQPPARSRAAFAYDPIRGEIVIFGGAIPNAASPDHAQTKLEDTWTWDGVDWTEQHPLIHPPGRQDASMAWDPNRGRLVLFGGTTALSYAMDDVWEWDGVAWSRVVVTDSPIRTRHALTPALGAGIASFGGQTAPGAPTSEVDELRWEGTSPVEGCRSNIDLDGDGLAGCADPDCWWACAPTCSPGTPCDPEAPHCGDGVCNTALEDGWICPADCTRPMICGDTICDPGETDCPGDCP